jgi:hypothetical protein
MPKVKAYKAVRNVLPILLAIFKAVSLPCRDPRLRLRDTRRGLRRVGARAVFWLREGERS